MRRAAFIQGVVTVIWPFDPLLARMFVAPPVVAFVCLIPLPISFICHRSP